MSEEEEYEYGQEEVGEDYGGGEYQEYGGNDYVEEAGYDEGGEAPPVEQSYGYENPAEYYGGQPPQQQYEYNYEPEQVDAAEEEEYAYPPEEIAPPPDENELYNDGYDYSAPEEPSYDYEPTPEEAELYEAVNKGNLESLDDNAPAVAAPAAGGSDHGLNFGSMFKGVMDGFGGGSVGEVIGEIHNIAGGGGGGGGGMLSNALASGALQGIISGAAHRFLGVNENTGRIIGAIAGDVLFNIRGQHNSLGGIGKVILDNIISGKYKRDVKPWVPPPTSGGGAFRSFGLNFEQERQRCLQDRRLFEDPEFPANDRALYFKNRPREHIEWKRPGEIVDGPQLIVEGHSRFDVMQGALGDCWLLAAVANLTLRDELFYRVVPPDQSFTENYAGIFHFQFWRYGQWVDVVIDDKLPTVDGRLCYMHSREHNEFWSALLEKAYAKLYGSYENLEGGTTVEALEDFTGGLTESFNLKEADKATILAMLVRGFQMGSLFGCSINADPNVKEAVLQNGLVRGHAYSVTSLHTVTTYRGETVLLRIRNPWGNSKEWNGPWSDSSSQWDDVGAEQRQAMNLSFAKDGEFWMSFDDFMREFEEVEVCNLSAAVMNEISEMTGVSLTAAGASSVSTATWTEVQEDGAWKEDQGTAGGCANNPMTYWRNPQFNSYFTVTDQSLEHDGKCTVIVAVLQKYRRELRVEGKDSLPIGFAVYEAPGQNTQLDMHYLRSHKSIARVPVFINSREVTVRFRVPPGDYVIIPSTFEAGCEADFLLRIYANGQVQTRRVG